MAELPSGAITFLFTDIEGSTQLVKLLRNRYGDVLREHQRLLRSAFESHGGHEVDTQGDSFFVAFTSARDGLLAAVEGQLALLSHSWPTGVEVKVRMGLHTGQAAATDGRYTGLAVHRAARIGAAGHGGQVLVSQSTQTLLEDEEEDLHIVLRDLGEQRLKDLDRPVRLYQATADGLPAAFPPVRHEAELARARTAPPLWRRPVVLAATALALAAVGAAAVVLASGDRAHGLAGVRANHVGLIDPATNDIVAEAPVGRRPGPIAVGGGSAWVGNLQDRTVTRIDLATQSGAGTISFDNRTPTGIAFGEGAVWVTHGGRGELSRIDPQFGQVTSTVKVAHEALGVQSGAVTTGSGAVWSVFADSTIARIDPADLEVLDTTFAGAAPAGVVVGSGSVWVTNSGEATVSRFNPSTFDEGPLRSFPVGRRPTGIAFGNGAIWVVYAGDDAVARIDPNSYATTLIPVGDEPVAIAVGARAVWVANAAAGTVSRIDPETNKVAETIELGNAPSGIAVGNGSVWVAVQAP